jgi:YegS/Rv2252/BmrU family lipid kinase
VIFLKHLYIVNPAAGGIKRKAEALVRYIDAFAAKLGEPHEVYVTKEPMDACRKINEEAEAGGMLRAYACGGDGTLNECVNGAAKRANVAITQYPCGTGNDFLKTFGAENIGRFRDLGALTAGDARPLDIIDCGGRYGINICSVGIDARIGNDVHKYSGIPLIGGKTGYIVSLVVNVIKGINQRLRITAEGQVFDMDTALVCACNGRFYGGGFNPVPDALADDGVLDFLVVKGISRLKVPWVVGQYGKGKFRELPELISHIRGKYMEIEGENAFAVNIDGEILTARKIRFQIEEKGVNFIFPPGL